IAAKALRHELRNRGLSAGDVDRVAEGRFVNEISVVAPTRMPGQKPLTIEAISVPGPATEPLSFEIQELKVELGQQVQAGRSRCVLANNPPPAVARRAFVGQPAAPRSSR